MADPKTDENNPEELRAAILAEMQRRGMTPPVGAPVAPAAAAEPVVAQPPEAAMLDPNAPTVPPEASYAPGGIVERALTDIVKGVAVEGPGAVIRGIGGAIKETGDLFSETIGGAKAAKEKLMQGASPTEKALATDTSGAVVGAVASGVSWLGSQVQGLYGKRETVTGDVIEGISQFATGMIGAGKFISLPAAVTKSVGGKVLQGAVRGAAVDLTVFDGNDKRLSNLIEEFPSLQNPITEFLAAKDSDGEALGRFKNAIEGVVIGPAADLLIYALRSRKAFANGDVAQGRADAELAQEIIDAAQRGTDEAAAGATKTADDAATAGAPKVDESAAAAPAVKVEYVNGEYVVRSLDDPKSSLGVGDTPTEAMAAYTRSQAKVGTPEPPVFSRGDLDDMEAAANALRGGGELTPRESRHADLAREDLLNEKGRPATDKEVADYLQEGVEADRARHRAASEAPKVDEPVPPAKPAEGADAPPYSTDLPMPRDGRGPIEFKAGDVLPNVSKADGERTIAALQSRFTVAGKSMVEEGADFNFRTIANEDDLKAAINAVSGAHEDLISRTKGGNADGVVSFQKMKNERDEFSDMFGVDPDRAIISIGHDAKTMEHLYSRFQAYKGLMQNAVNDAAKLADAALAYAPGSPQHAKASAEALHSAMIATQIQAMVKGIQTNVARTLVGMKIAPPSDLLKKGLGNYEDLAKRLQEGTFHSDDEKLLKHLASLKNNPKGFLKYMEKSFSEKAGGAFQEWYLNALLSGPKTHVANFIGNTMMTGYMPLERAVQGMMLGSGKSTGDVVRGLKDEYDGLGMALMDSFRIAGTALKQNKSVLDPGNGTHLDPTGRNVGGLSSRALGFTNDFYDTSGRLIRTEGTPILSGMLDGLQAVVGIPSRLLTGSDELFKQLNYRSYLYTDAAAKADKAGLVRGTDGWKNYVSQEMNRGFDENGIAAAMSPNDTVRGLNKQNSMQGLQQAREATFTQDLEGGISRWLQGASNDHIWLKTIVPFVRTPTNIFRFAMRHGPLAPISYGFIRDLRGGGEPARKAMAQLTTGSAMWAAATWLASSGVITGGFSADPEVRKGQEMNGAKEYAIRVGDKYVQYNRLDPFATVFGLAADFAKLTTHVSEVEADKVATALTVTLARNLASKTYVQGITNAFNAIGDAMSGRSLTGLDSFAYRTAASIAIPSIVNSAKDDPALREVRNMVDAMKARLPGYSKEVPPVRNILGEVVDAPTGWLLGPASPLGYSRDKKDVVAAELGRLMERTNTAIGRVMPNLGETKIDLREVKLANGQQAYDRLQQLVAESGVKERLRALITDPQWETLKDGSMDYPKADGSKMWLVTKVMETAKNEAKNRLLAENPDLMKMYHAELIRSKSEGILGPQPRAYTKPGFLDSVFGR